MPRHFPPPWSIGSRGFGDSVKVLRAADPGLPPRLHRTTTGLPARGACRARHPGELYGRRYDRTRHWRLSEVWGAEHTGAGGL
jgi:hypothetical protein